MCPSKNVKKRWFVFCLWYWSMHYLLFCKKHSREFQPTHAMECFCGRQHLTRICEFIYGKCEFNVSIDFFCVFFLCCRQKLPPAKVWCFFKNKMKTDFFFFFHSRLNWFIQFNKIKYTIRCLKWYFPLWLCLWCFFWGRNQMLFL